MKSPVEPSPDAHVDRLLQNIAATGRVSWNDLDTLISYVQALKRFGHAHQLCPGPE